LNAGAFTIRHGRPDDRGFLLDLGKRTVGDSLSECRPAPLALAQASYEGMLDFTGGQSHLVLIAESRLERLGFLLLLDDLPDEVTSIPQAFVAYMAVEPYARRRGVGRALLAAAEDAARERGLPFLALMVTEDNLSARGLYAQAGYATERRLVCKAL
jgi:ribosomal protein S18 acetylase RimI-like enzyme